MNASAPSPSPPPARHAPIALWRVAEAFMHTLYNLFGAPEDVAAEVTLTRLIHGQLLSWLRCAEAMLRRLLLIEAAAYSGPLQSNEPGTQRARKPRQRTLKEFYAHQPETWRVSFRCFSPTLRQAQRDAEGGVAGSVSVGLSLSKAKRPVPQSAWPLAERYEAVLRAFNNPAPYAKRLARRLRAIPQRVSELFRAPEEAENRVDDFVLMRDLAEAALGKTPRLDAP